MKILRHNKSFLPAPLDTRSVVATYRRIAPVYDIWGKLTESKAQDVCIDWLEVPDGGKVLDVATGTGSLLEKVVRRAPDCSAVGIDITPAMLRRAALRRTRRRVRYDLAVADARSLPIRSASIDLILNAYMFDLLPEREFATVLEEFSRVLAPGGRLALINMTIPARMTERVWQTIYRIYPPLLGGCRGVLMKEPLERAGFSVERRTRVSQAGFPSEVLLARVSSRNDGSR